MCINLKTKTFFDSIKGQNLYLQVIMWLNDNCKSMFENKIHSSNRINKYQYLYLSFTRLKRKSNFWLGFYTIWLTHKAEERGCQNVLIYTEAINTMEGNIIITWSQGNLGLITAWMLLPCTHIYMIYLMDVCVCVHVFVCGVACT